MLQKNFNYLIGTLLVFLSLIIILVGLIYRQENIFTICYAFIIILWFIQIPGMLILSILHNEVKHQLRFLLTSHALGLSILPIVYYTLYTIDQWQIYGVIQSILNLTLLGILYFKNKDNLISFITINLSKDNLIHFGIILLFSTLPVLIREFSQLRIDNLAIITTNEIDSGFLMGVVAGIKHYGSCMNMNEGVLPLDYHHFIYLLMALVSKYSNATILSTYQVVFPLYTFFFLSIATYWLTKETRQNNKVALISAILILVLEDFSILNQIIRFLFNTDPVSFFYTTYNTNNLHRSPSLIISLAISIALLGELGYLRKKSLTDIYKAMPFVIIASFLVGYKATSWACIIGGMGVASLFFIKRTPVLMALTIVSGIGGFIVLAIFVGSTSASASIKDVYIGYPIFNNPSVQFIFNNIGHHFLPSDFNLKLFLIMVFLVPIWVGLTYGIRCLWFIKMVKNMKTKKQNLNYIELTAFFSIIIGLLISLVAAPKNTGSFNVYYFSMFGLIISVPFTIPLIYKYITTHSKKLMSFILILLVFLQIGSGLVHIFRPFINTPIAILSKDWLEAMEYLRNHTDSHSRLISNRFDYNTDPNDTNTKEKFYFIPAFSERAVITSGNKFYTTPDEGYQKRRELVDALLHTNSWVKGKSISDRLNANYIIVDKWKGESLNCTDPRFVTLIYHNTAVDIYKIMD